jgi:hypothetical protein
LCGKFLNHALDIAPFRILGSIPISFIRELGGWYASLLYVSIDGVSAILNEELLNKLILLV